MRTAVQGLSQWKKCEMGEKIKMDIICRSYTIYSFITTDFFIVSPLPPDPNARAPKMFQALSIPELISADYRR